MNTNLEQSMTAAVCKECGSPLDGESAKCQTCTTPSYPRQVVAAICRNYAIGSTFLFVLVLVITKERTWIENLPVVIGFLVISLLGRSLAGLAEQPLAKASRWKHVISGLGTVAVLDWLIRTELIWAAVAFAIIGAVLYAIVLVLRSPRPQPSTGAGAHTSIDSANLTPAAAPSPTASSGGGGKNWFAFIVAAIALVALKVQFQRPPNQPGIVKPPQPNAQVAKGTERFWNERIVGLALLEQELPEPAVDQTFEDYTTSLEELLAVGIERFPAAGGSSVEVDAINLFNRHRNDLVELRGAIAAVRTKSTNADLHRPAIHVIAAANAALAANAVDFNDPAASALFSLVERLEKHEVERAAMQGKLSERFPTCVFKIPE